MESISQEIKMVSQVGTVGFKRESWSVGIGIFSERVGLNQSQLPVVVTK